VKELMLSDDRRVFFTTPHFDGYPAVLVRIPDLARLDRGSSTSWSSKRGSRERRSAFAKGWLEEHGLPDG
jgi:hypothetical protein